MTASCPQCHKQLKVRDEWAGKMLKCPGCGTKFAATASTAAGPTMASRQPTAASVSGAKQSTKPVAAPRKQTGGGIAINTNVILMLAGVGAILALVLATIFGPVRVKRHWEAHSDDADAAVRDVVEFAMKARASGDGTWNPRKASGTPTIGDLRMLPDIFTLSIPETVRFDGFGTVGKFEGTYNFETGEVVCDLKVGGMMLPSGVFVSEDGVSVAGGQRDSKAGGVGKAAAAAGRRPGPAGGDTMHVTGRLKGGAPVVEIDGRKAEIYMPPAVDEDGNRI